MTISELEPREVWGYFGEILEIPRPSKHEEQIRAYLRGFAGAHDLEIQEDQKGNIVIRRPATSGAEGWTPVILQSHMDMVCEVSAGVEHDFMADPITAYIEDGWVMARDTTLGADCGIGMALQLAVLSAVDTPLPAIEALFTVDEEQGLSGAMALGEGMLRYQRMINLDSEDEGEIFIGCAGGVDTIAEFDFGLADATKGLSAASEGQSMRLIIGGLRGGHSGDDINKGRASATKLLVRLLWMLVRDHNAGIVSIDAGNLRNAIARDAVAEIIVGDTAAARIAVEKMTQELRAEFAHSDAGLTISFEPMNKKPTQQLEKPEKMLQALLGLPNGVLQDSIAMPGLVETSSNLASLKMLGPGVVVATTSQRSLVESAKWYARDMIAAVLRLGGATVRHSDGYPGWTPQPHSEFVMGAAHLYNKMFGTPPKVKAIHAGLECGLFLDKYPSLDIISIGPTLRDVHSPSERMEIGTVQKTWDFLLGLLQLDKK